MSQAPDALLPLVSTLLHLCCSSASPAAPSAARIYPAASSVARPRALPHLPVLMWCGSVFGVLHMVAFVVVVMGVGDVVAIVKKILIIEKKEKKNPAGAYRCR
jgi:hypothetical protein